MTVATTDGTVFAFRYSSEGQSRSLFYSTDVSTLRQYPRQPSPARAVGRDQIIVSEPLGDLAGAWNEVPESSYGVIQQGQTSCTVRAATTVLEEVCSVMSRT